MRHAHTLARQVYFRGCAFANQVSSERAAAATAYRDPRASLIAPGESRESARARSVPGGGVARKSIPIASRSDATRNKTEHLSRREITADGDRRKKRVAARSSYARARASTYRRALAPRREGATDNSFSGSRKCRRGEDWTDSPAGGLNWSRDSRNRIATATASPQRPAAAFSRRLPYSAVGSRNLIITARARVDPDAIRRCRRTRTRTLPSSRQIRAEALFFSFFFSFYRGLHREEQK